MSDTLEKTYQCPHCSENLTELKDWYLECNNCGWSGTITQLYNMNKQNEENETNTTPSRVEKT